VPALAHAAVVARALRPKQWLKNGFVLAPALFSGHAFDPPALLRAAGVAVAFCLASSAGYLINDLLDREADSNDPVKKNRPIAAGLIGTGEAIAWACALLAAAVVATAVQSWSVMAVLLAYAALTLLYSFVLKTIPIVEAMTLAAGFLVRLAAGALAIHVVISHWLLICGSLLALLLAFGKRVPEQPNPARRTPLYPSSFIHDVVTLLAAMTLVSYTLYTVAPDTVAKFGSRALLLTVPLVLFGILRYLLLLHSEGAQDPTAALVGDRPLLAAVIVWAVLAGAIVYFGGRPP
jgi:4-hydroxybenzoate polyprenyltransferase